MHIHHGATARPAAAQPFMVARLRRMYETSRNRLKTSAVYERCTAGSIVRVAVVMAVIAALAGATLGDADVYSRANHAVLGDGRIYGWLIGTHGFTYPPFAAVAMSVFGKMSPLLMWCVFGLLSVGALTVVMRLIAAGDLAAVRRGDKQAGWRVSALILALPVTETFRYGQIALLLAAIVLLDLLVVRRGVLIGLAMALKLTPAVFVLYLLVQRRFREAGTAIAVFIATVGAAWLILPEASTQYWLHNVFAGTGTGGFGSSNNQSILGLLLHVFGSEASHVAWLALAVPITVLGLWLAHRVNDLNAPVLAAGIVGVTGCLVSPLSWSHHWVWMLPLLAGFRGVNRFSGAVGSRLIGCVATLLVLGSVVPGSGVVLVPCALVMLVWIAVVLRRHAAIPGTAAWPGVDPEGKRDEPSIDHAWV
jgi:alpha-1,2-mannosyltransferase